MNIKRISGNAALVAAPVAIALAASLLMPTPAAADPMAPPTGACPGTRVGTYRLSTSSHIEIYYSPANGGTNCVTTVSEKTSRRYLHVWATVVGTDKINSDEGLYRSYAGPITFTGAAGHCISVMAQASPSTNPAERTKRSLDAVHCG
ncbi:hypothetical protein EES44_24550 [Streptomyces sp. ADI96-15]|uniref:hypothetical protein n=1 Tax=Streptomyces sp. ADI96-15 TaxID=1522761 RepID=UPI000F54F054|nr:MULTISPECIES: hypothetical protein [unclassified Streptomyces]MDH6189176.1 hypothetical protein [Streptomyces sp. CZ24]RPK58106.1 hypothetical protein EES44_24550 [Streptomyces sp. ADI96-15]